MFHRLMCRLGWCRHVRLYETHEGIGGRCIRCQKVYGWTSVDELKSATGPSYFKAMDRAMRKVNV